MAESPVYFVHKLQHIPSGTECTVRQHKDKSLAPGSGFCEIGWDDATRSAVRAALVGKPSDFSLVSSTLYAAPCR